MAVEMIKGQAVYNETHAVYLGSVHLLSRAPRDSDLEVLAVAAARLDVAAQLYVIRDMAHDPVAQDELAPALEHVLKCIDGVLQAARSIFKLRQVGDDSENVATIINKMETLKSRIHHTLCAVRQQHVHDGVEALGEVVWDMRRWVQTCNSGYASPPSTRDVAMFVENMANSIAEGLKLIRGKDNG